MLNNKKSLLQRLQLVMTALVLIIGFGGAFAANASKTRGLVTYAVIATNANSYSVTTDLSGTCGTQTAKHCILKSAQPETGGQIPLTPIVPVTSGQFTPAP